MTATLGPSGRRPDDRGEELVQRELRTIGFGLLFLVILAAVVLAILYDAGDSEQEQAQQLAGELVASLDAAGLQSPDEDVAARVYGTDGGAGCRVADADSLSALAALATRGTGEVAARPTLVDRRFVEYQRIMLQTYCPERVDDFDDMVDGLRLRRTLDVVR
jgi:hypothetical protein